MVHVVLSTCDGFSNTHFRQNMINETPPGTLRLATNRLSKIASLLLNNCLVARNQKKGNTKKEEKETIRCVLINGNFHSLTVDLYTDLLLNCILLTRGKTGQKIFFRLANFLLYVNDILIKIYLKIILKEGNQLIFKILKQWHLL